MTLDNFFVLEAINKSDARWNAEIIVKFTTAYPFRYPQSCLLCVVCAEKFQDPVAFREHMKENHKKINTTIALKHVSSDNFLKVDCTELACRICKKPYQRLEEVARHLRDEHHAKLHLDNQLEILPYIMDSNRISCGICDANHAGFLQLGKHLATHFTRCTCENCGKAYTNLTSMKHHARFCQKEGKFVCQRCLEPFDTAEERRHHILNSKICWRYYCDECKERFMLWKEKQNHLVQVHGKPSKTYPCTECGEVFASKFLYTKHFRLTHRPGFTCQFCGRTWESERMLQRHLVVHTKEMPFTCEHCSKGFRTKQELVQHSWIHNENKRFSCEICDKQFNQRVSWKGHMKHHHPELVDF